jgi:hypothetical protein
MNNDFEGLRIMSPEEVESSITKGDGTEQSEESNEGFSLSAPEGVSTEDKEDDDNKQDDVPEGKPASTTTVSLNEDKTALVYKALIKEMVDNGILTIDDVEKLDEMEGSLDSIKSLLQHTVESNTNAKQESWKNGLSKSKKRFFEIEDAFDDEDMAIQMTNNLEFFDTITEETLTDDVPLQKQLYRDLLIAKGFSKEDADEKVEDADALGKLDSEALKALPQLKKQALDYVNSSREERVKQHAKSQESMTNNFNNLMSSIDSKESIIDGITLNKVSRDKLKENIVKTVYTDEAGRPYTSLMNKQRTNAAEFDILINYYDGLGLFNQDKNGNFKPDISKLKNIAKTKAVNEVDRIIAQDNERRIGGGNSIEPTEMQSGILSLLKSAYGKK